MESSYHQGRPTGRHALVVHAHPDTDSFVAAMRDTIRSVLSGAGYTIVESDLYATDFNPILSPADFPNPGPAAAAPLCHCCSRRARHSSLIGAKTGRSLPASR